MYESIELFPFIDLFFGPTAEFDKVSNQQKQKHCFMLKQFLSKGIPADVAKFKDLDHFSVVDALHHRCRHELKLTRKPQWIYAKGTASNAKPLIKRFSIEAIELVQKEFDYEYKTIVDLTIKYPELMEVELSTAEKYIKDGMSFKKTKA